MAETHINAFYAEVADAEVAVAQAKGRLAQAKADLEARLADEVGGVPEAVVSDELHDLTNSELHKIAEAEDVVVDAKANKATLVDAIEQKRAEPPVVPPAEAPVEPPAVPEPTPPAEPVVPVEPVVDTPVETPPNPES